MQFSFKDFEELIKTSFKKPLAVLLFVLCICSLFFLKAYLEKKGEIVATPSVADEKIKSNSIGNPSGEYVLAADMNILNNYVHIDGVTVQGNVNVDNAKGINLREMRVLQQEGHSADDKGRINVNRSQEFSIKDNVVENEINIDRSKLFVTENNIVGK